MITPFSTVALGAPKLGKSTFAASMAEVIPPEKIALLVTKPNELNSWGYEHYKLRERAQLIYDEGWRPSLGQFKAEGFVRLMQAIYNLYDDREIEGVIVETGTDVCELLKHKLLAPYKATSLSDLRQEGKDANYSYWDEFGEGMKEFFQATTNLATPLVKKSKFVIVTWHVQPQKEGDAKTGKKSADQTAAGVEFEGNVLPMIDGSYRRKLAADVDCVAFFDVETVPRKQVEYVMRVVPNSERHAGVRLAPSLAQALIPNNFGRLLEEIEKART